MQELEQAVLVHFRHGAGFVGTEEKVGLFCNVCFGARLAAQPGTRPSCGVCVRGSPPQLTPF